MVAPTSSHRNKLVIGAGLAVVLALGFVIARRYLEPARAGAPTAEQPTAVQDAPTVELPKHLFANWGVPEVAFILSGQTFGYLQPCGCSEPQYGGLVRRYNLMKALEKKGWKMAGIDLGEIFPKKGEGDVAVLPDQAMERFKTTLRSLEKMNYQEFGLGAPEYKMPLINGLAHMLALNVKNPRPLSLDVQDPGGQLQPFAVRSYDVITGGPNQQPVKVGVTSMVGPSVAAALKGVPNANFFDNGKMIQTLLPKLANEKIDVVILLFHGTPQEAENVAKMCHAERQKNPALPNVDLILHTSDFDTPPARPQLVQGTETRVIYPGHKGKDVGVLGVFRKPAGGYELKYEFVQLGPEFKTPDAAIKGHPIMDLIQEYAETVKTRNFLDAYKPYRIDHPTQRAEVLVKNGVEAKYVGSERCSGCHAAEYKVWEDAVKVYKGRKIGHSVAIDSLLETKHPNLRQFDPECVACHTTGFKYRTGYYDPPAGANAKQILKHNERLEQVGCESCHGPASMHVDMPNNAAYYPLINPIKNVDRDPVANQLLDRFCQSCHDIENDVHWNKQKFDKAWKLIRHTGLKNAPPGKAPVVPPPPAP